MSNKAINWALSACVRLPAERLLLLVLANRANGDNYCFPGRDTLAEACCMSTRYVSKTARALEKLELIKVEVGHGCNRGTNKYRLLINGQCATHCTMEDGCQPEPQFKANLNPSSGWEEGANLNYDACQPEPQFKANLNPSSTKPKVEPKEEPKDSKPPHSRPAKKDRRSPLPCPYGKIIDLYHETLPQLRHVRIITETRKKYIQARWREDESRQDLEYWRRLFGYIAESPFLTGSVDGRNGSPPFQADLEWIVRPSNFAKIIEGKYHG